jgi:hypothetical protein
MQAAGQAWISELRSHIVGLRDCNPLPDRQLLDSAEEWQCRIIGGSLLNWLNEIGPDYLQERKVLSKLLEIEPEPLIVFTSTVPGLIAATEIITPENESVLFLADDDFAKWSRQHPDAEYCWHVHFWSYFHTSPDQEFLAQAQEQYPLDDEAETYWQHVEGTMWGQQAGRGVDHLWKWDGKEPLLLEEAFSHWVSPGRTWCRVATSR